MTPARSARSLPLRRPDRHRHGRHGSRAARRPIRASPPIRSIATSTTRISAPSIAPSAPSTARWARRKAIVLSFDTIAEKIEEMIALGGTGILHAGRPASRSAHRVLRESAALDQAALPAGASALLFGAGNSVHRRSLRALSVRDTIARLRDAGLDSHSRRRRGNPRRRNSRAHLAPQVHRRRMGADAPHRALARPAHHRDHDVRLRRGVSATA